jgi:LPS export ABC transporter protein LptC
MISCEDNKDLLNEEVYEGPVMEMQDISTMMSDSFQLVMKLEAPKRMDFDEGDVHYPEGLFLTYYDNEEAICTFKSDFAKYLKEENVWEGEGNVVVRNLENGDELNTEQLFWSPNEKKFYTEKFVTIVTEGEIHTGEGLEANEDFSSYKILKPSGTFTVEEDF